MHPPPPLAGRPRRKGKMRRVSVETRCQVSQRIDGPHAGCNWLGHTTRIRSQIPGDGLERAFVVRIPALF